MSNVIGFGGESQPIADESRAKIAIGEMVAAISSMKSGCEADLVRELNSFEEFTQMEVFDIEIVRDDMNKITKIDVKVKI